MPALEQAFSIGSNNDRSGAKGAHRHGFGGNLWRLVLDSSQIISFAHQLAVFYVDESIIENQIQSAVIVARLAFRPCALQRENASRRTFLRLLLPEHRHGHSPNQEQK